MKNIQTEYKKFLLLGCNRLQAIQIALDENIEGYKPYIYKDEYGDFSHVFFEESVMFEDGEIYTKQLSTLK